MSRIPTPATISTSPAASQPFLEAVNKQLGSVPNLFRMLGNSPAALEGYLGLSGALGKGRLDARTRARVAMRVAELNGCGYCLAAHTFLGVNMARLSPEELSANQAGESEDPKSTAALRFVSAVVAQRGHVAVEDIQAVKAAGFDDAQVVELVLNVALNVLTNYLNSALATDIDFPQVARRAA